MNKDEAILKIKEQLKKLMSFSETSDDTTEDVKMENIKLKDGSEIMIPDGSNLEPGVEVYMLDADGNQTPCEDGDYVLENGQTITVKGGSIDAVADTEQPADAEQTESPVDPAKMESQTPDKTTDTVPAAGDDLSTRVSALEDQIAQILELLQGMSNSQEMAMSKIKEIADAPGATSTKLTKTYANVSINSVKNEMDELKEMTKKFKLKGSGYNFNAS